MNPTSTAPIEAEEERLERIAVAVAQAVVKSLPQDQSSSANRFMTLGQGLLGMILTTLIIIGMAFSYTSGVETKFSTIDQRVTKTEYQNQISITDRADIHVHLEHTDAVGNETNTRLARMEVLMQTLVDTAKSRSK